MSAGGSAGLERLPTRQIKKFGWHPDLPDYRDHEYAVKDATAALPPSFDNSTNPAMPPVWDQGDLGSCTGHGVGAVVAYEIKKATGKDFMPSRLFIYYGERVIEGDVSQDNGAAIRDGVKVVNQIGCPPEADWPYDVTKFAQKPPDAAFKDALAERAISYSRVNRKQIKDAVLAGHLVVFGFTCFSSFEAQGPGSIAQGGVMPMPAPGEQSLGGHCVVIVGYDDSKNAWKVRNSWGPDWGDHGYFWMPYAYTAKSNLSSDFWTVTAEGAKP